MGLNICKKILKYLGGKISIKSEEDRGSIFSISLPSNPISNAESIIQNDNMAINQNIIQISIMNNFQNSLSYASEIKMENNIEYEEDNYHFGNVSSKRMFPCHCPQILIVDDETGNRFVLKSYTNRIGIKSDEAKNGREACTKVIEFNLNYLCICNYKLILMDSNMPIMNGEEASIQIRNFIKKKGISPILIICITANADLTLKKINEYNYIYDEVMYKPLAYDNFCQMIKKCMNID